MVGLRRKLSGPQQSATGNKLLRKYTNRWAAAFRIAIGRTADNLLHPKWGPRVPVGRGPWRPGWGPL